MHPSILDEYNDSPIAFNRHYVTIGCGINGALMLTQAVYWSKKAKRDGRWFYKTQAEWEEETGMTRREQETARKRLVELGVMEEKLAGVPAKMHYRVDVLRVHQLLLASLDLVDDQECSNPPIQYGGKRQSGMRINANLLYTENTTETTTDIGDAFEVFWTAGMRKLNKKGALKAFQAACKRLKAEPQEFAQKLADDVKARLKSGQLGFDAMHPTTYLNNERWEDEVLKPVEKPAFNADSDRWWTSDAGIQRKAAQEGVYSRPGESYRDLADRIRVMESKGVLRSQQPKKEPAEDLLRDQDIPY